MKVVTRTTMRDHPSGSAARVRAFMPGAELTPTGQKQVEQIADGSQEWWEVKYIEANANVVIQGWVLAADVEDVAAARPEVDDGRFRHRGDRRRAAVQFHRRDSPWLVSANYIIARALIETDIVNSAPRLEGSDGVGPLQVSSAEWKLRLPPAPPTVRSRT